MIDQPDLRRALIGQLYAEVLSRRIAAAPLHFPAAGTRPARELPLESAAPIPSNVVPMQRG